MEHITCDRCGETVEGFRTERFTSGFYDTSEGYWAKFSNPGEKAVCDACMHADARYRAAYGLPDVSR